MLCFGKDPRSGDFLSLILTSYDQKKIQVEATSSLYTRDRQTEIYTAKNPSIQQQPVGERCGAQLAPGHDDDRAGRTFQCTRGCIESYEDGAYT